MFDKQAGQADMPRAQTRDALAPIDLLAIATAKDGVELRHALQPVHSHRHAKSHARRHLDPTGAGHKTRGHVIQRITLPRHQRMRRADHGHGHQLGIIGHRRDAGDLRVLHQRCNQPRSPGLRHEGVRIQQHHRPAPRDRQRETTIDAADEAQVLRIFDQCRAFAQPGETRRKPRPHARIGRGILDRDQMERQVGMGLHPVDHLLQQLERIVDRQDDRHARRGRADRCGQRGHEQPRVDLDPVRLGPQAEGAADGGAQGGIAAAPPFLDQRQRPQHTTAKARYQRQRGQHL